ncbi:MAG TPA: hypothetical protein PLF92_14535, partial [Arenimonas sp.]|nr:hypothetical protein [Arenimonas sp.]
MKIEKLMPGDWIASMNQSKPWRYMHGLSVAVRTNTVHFEDLCTRCEADRFRLGFEHGGDAIVFHF